MSLYTQFEDDNSLIKYHGDWTATKNDSYRGGSRITNNIKTDIKNQYIEIFFRGTGFRIISSTYPTYSASIAIEIDDTIIEEFSLSAQDADIVEVYSKENLEDTVHKIKMYRNVTGNYTPDFIFDGIDIIGDGKLVEENEYINRDTNVVPYTKKSAVKIGDDTIESEEDIEAYAQTLVNGERQLLIALKSLYLTDGKGGYEKINEVDIHDNKNVLDLLSTDGKDLFFNGKNIQSIIAGDNRSYSATLLNVTNGQTCTINIDSGSNLCEQIVQAWEFEEGETDLITIAKTFNNAEKDNFYYNSNEIEFTNSECKVKDKYILNSNLNSDGFYESEIINKDDFVDFIGLEVI